MRQPAAVPPTSLQAATLKCKMERLSTSASSSASTSSNAVRTKRTATSYGQQRLGVLGVPWDLGSSFATGAAEGPAQIRAALQSDHWNSACELTGEDTVKWWDDVGDVDLANRIKTGDAAAAMDAIEAKVTQLKKIDILHFDAHPDLYDKLDNNAYSHACPFARIMESQPVGRLLQVGIRTMNTHQREQAERFGVEVVHMHNIQSLQKYADTLVFDNPLYISVDLDVLDPAFCPGVSHNEPGGLSTRELLTLLQRVQAPEVVGADVVELNANLTNDPSGRSKYVAAKVFKELVALMCIAPPFHWPTPAYLCESSWIQHRWNTPELMD
eukprot:gene8520-11680_t